MQHVIKVGFQVMNIERATERSLSLEGSYTLYFPPSRILEKSFRKNRAKLVTRNRSGKFWSKSVMI